MRRVISNSTHLAANTGGVMLGEPIGAVDAAALGEAASIAAALIP